MKRTLHAAALVAVAAGLVASSQVAAASGLSSAGRPHAAAHVTVFASGFNNP